MGVGYIHPFLYIQKHRRLQRASKVHLLHSLSCQTLSIAHNLDQDTAAKMSEWAILLCLHTQVGEKSPFFLPPPKTAWFIFNTGLNLLRRQASRMFPFRQIRRIGVVVTTNVLDFHCSEPAVTTTLFLLERIWEQSQYKKYTPRQVVEKRG